MWTYLRFFSVDLGKVASCESCPSDLAEVPPTSPGNPPFSALPEWLTDTSAGLSLYSVLEMQRPHLCPALTLESPWVRTGSRSCLGAQWVVSRKGAVYLKGVRNHNSYQCLSCAESGARHSFQGHFLRFCVSHLCSELAQEKPR